MSHRCLFDPIAECKDPTFVIGHGLFQILDLVPAPRQVVGRHVDTDVALTSCRFARQMIWPCLTHRPVCSVGRTPFSKPPPVGLRSSACLPDPRTSSRILCLCFQRRSASMCTAFPPIRSARRGLPKTLHVGLSAAPSCPWNRYLPWTDQNVMVPA